MNIFNKNIIMLGAGGHAKVILDIAKINGINVSHIVDIREKLDLCFSDIEHITSDNLIIKDMPSGQSSCINALGVIPGKNKLLRSNVYQYYKKSNFKFLKMIHPSAIIANSVNIEAAVNIMAGVVIQAHSTIKENTIINTGVLIDHDCYIEQNVHIAPGAVLCGNVKVGKESFIGAGAKVLPNIVIPENSIIKAGTILK